MNKLFYILVFFLYISVVSCQQKSWEERCLEDAKVYNFTHCPKNIGNGIILDSLVYSVPLNQNTYYYRVTGELDNDSVFAANHKTDIEILQQAINNSIDLKTYKDHHMRFQYVYRSADLSKVYLNVTFSYNKENGIYSID